MRKFTWLVAAGLAASTTGCVETMDSSYGSGGYGAGYGGQNNGYYSQPANYYRPAPVNNYYYTPPPQVVTQTRYVPVPVPAPQRASTPDRNGGPRGDGNRGDGNRGDGTRGDGHRGNNDQHTDRSRSNTPPVATPPAANPPTASNGGQQQSNRRRGTAQDRDGDGKPDTPPTRPDRRS